MIKVGDVLEGYEAVQVSVEQAVLKNIETGNFSIWQIQNGYLRYNYMHNEKPDIDLTPKPVYDGAFGENVGLGECFYTVTQDIETGRFRQCGGALKLLNQAANVEGVFTNKERAESYADALNCLQIDLRKNSVVPVDGVKQWTISLQYNGKLGAYPIISLHAKLKHTFPLYKTKEEAEKHLADAERIIKSLKEMKGMDDV